MAEERNFWTRNHISRRAALRGAGLGVAGLAGAALIGCGGDDDESTSSGGGAATGAAATAAPAGAMAVQPGGEIKGFATFDVDTFDVQSATSYKTAVINAWTQSRLVQYDPGVGGDPAPGSVTGDLAETIEQVDELTYTFKLRTNAPWDVRPPTNGRALDSEDVVQTWLKFKDTSAYRAILSNDVSDIAPIKSIEAVDDLTVKMKLAHPDALVLPIMAWYLSGVWIYPKEAFNGEFDPATDVRGNGPWILDEYTPAVSFKFKKNPTWYAGPQTPYADKWSWPIITDAAQREAQFRAGNIHVGGPHVSNMPITLKETSGTELYTGPPGTGGNTFGMSRRPGSGFNDERVRRATSMTIDRDTFNEVFNDPQAFADVGMNMNSYWNSPLGPGNGAFWLDPKGSKFGPAADNLKHNVAEAKKLLDAAGFDDASPFEFDLIFPGVRYGSDWPARGETFQAMASDAGIKIHLWVVDYATEWIAKPPTGVFRTFSDFEGRDGRKSAVTYRPNGARSTPGEWFATFHHSAGSNNEVGDHWPELDTLIEAARKINDFEERVEAIHDVQRFMVKNMTSIPVEAEIDGVGIKWAGLHGPDTTAAWGASPNQYREIYPLWWLDDTLRT